MTSVYWPVKVCKMTGAEDGATHSLVTQTELARGLRAVMRRVRAGEVVLVTFHGRPVVRLEAVEVVNGDAAAAQPEG